MHPDHINPLAALALLLAGCAGYVVQAIRAARRLRRAHPRVTRYLPRL